MTVLVLSMLLAADSDWRQVSQDDGVMVEVKRPADQPFETIRVSTHTEILPESLITSQWAEMPPTVRERIIIEDGHDDRRYYDRVSVPVVADRDYLVHIWRTIDQETGVRQITWKAIEDPRFPPKPGIVRMRRVEGSLTIEPAGHGSDLTYVIYSDPGGSLPHFFVTRALRSAAVDYVQNLMERAGLLATKANR